MENAAVYYIYNKRKKTDTFSSKNRLKIAVEDYGKIIETAKS